MCPQDAPPTVRAGVRSESRARFSSRIRGGENPSDMPDSLSLYSGLADATITTAVAATRRARPDPCSVNRRLIAASGAVRCGSDQDSAS